MGAVDELVEDGSVACFFVEFVVFACFHSADWAFYVLCKSSAWPKYYKRRRGLSVVESTSSPTALISLDGTQETHSVPDFEMFRSWVNSLTNPRGCPSNHGHIPLWEISCPQARLQTLLMLHPICGREVGFIDKTSTLSKAIFGNNISRKAFERIA